jgi:acetyl-CoA synthetase
MAKLETLAAHQNEVRPPRAVRERATLQDYEAAYRRSIEDPEGYWAEVAKGFSWITPWQRVLEWDGVHHRWFTGATTNITLNALDRHVAAGKKNKLAYLWLGEDGHERSLTYGMLLAQVNRVANGLKRLGVVRGDRVLIYMPLTLEGVIAMLACARIGAVHSVVYAGFAAGALRARIEDAQAKVVITGDVSYRRGKGVDLLAIARNAAEPLDFIEHMVVFRREAQRPLEGREVPWERFFEESPHCDAEVVDAEHPLYILYTSGTTGRPKGVVHVHGGYMVGTAHQLRTFYDLDEDDVFWNMSDIGWAVGHSYIAYAPLLSGITTIFREGAPDTPHPGVAWEIVERYGVTAILTAPTVVRMWMRHGEEPLKGRRLDTLRLLAVAGEPLNPEAFRWAQTHLMGEHGMVRDNWWQTETGAPTLGTFPTQAYKPGFVGRPVLGVEAVVLSETGERLPPNEGGLLALTRPFPNLLRTIHGAPERYEAAWREFPGYYLTGDVAVCDEAGRFSVLGRADDVLSVAGHRIGTADVESALVSHPAVAEAAVIGVPDELKGEVIVAFVVLRSGRVASPEALTEHVRNELGAIAAPSEVHLVETLPKTRSGKIMRRLLRAQVLGQDPGDTSTLES